MKPMEAAQEMNENADKIARGIADKTVTEMVEVTKNADKISQGTAGETLAEMVEVTKHADKISRQGMANEIVEVTENADTIGQGMTNETMTKMEVTKHADKISQGKANEVVVVTKNADTIGQGLADETSTEMVEVTKHADKISQGMANEIVEVTENADTIGQGMTNETMTEMEEVTKHEDKISQGMANEIVEVTKNTDTIGQEMTNETMTEMVEVTEHEDKISQGTANETVTGVVEVTKNTDQGMANEVVTETVQLYANNGGTTGGNADCGNKKGGCSTIRSRVPQQFLQKLWDMTENEETNSIIRWSPSGTSFIIRDQTLFTTKVLPAYFKTANFSSFNCQLNSYGFRKISFPGEWEFKNDNFQRGKWDLLNDIKRRDHIIQKNKLLAPKSVRSPSTYNMEEELLMLTEKHELQKLEIIKLKETQQKLEDKLAAVKMSLICNEQKVLSAAQELLEKQKEVSNVEVETNVNGGQISEESTKGKRKLEEEEEEISATSGSYKPTMCSEADVWCPLYYDGDEGDGEENVFASLDYLVGESSEWSEYYREMLEKARNAKS